jgi:fatty acid desaturase
MSDEHKPTNPRAQRRREQRRLFWAVIIFLVVGGGAAIAVSYGSRAVVLGVTCLLAGASLLGLIWLILLLIERLAE